MYGSIESTENFVEKGENIDNISSSGICQRPDSTIFSQKNQINPVKNHQTGEKKLHQN